MKTPDNHILIIFGASGDLTARKLMPALYDLQLEGMLPERFAVLGIGRTAFSDDSFREKMRKALKSFMADKALENGKTLDKFIGRLFYQAIDTKDVDDYALLRNRLEELDKHIDSTGNHIFYLATPPSLYEIVARNLAAHGLNRKSDESLWPRLIVEKPFGYDLETAKQLNAKILEFFRERQLYRIDHYLGKETVQNILVTRFSNSLFEPLWNRNYIHHIEITSAENIGVGQRGGYYDQSGALRDMVQNHLLQLVGLVAMEPPVWSDSLAIRNEMLKVFQSLRPLQEDDILNNTIRGQYTASHIRQQSHKGYREEEGVAPNSKTETFFAMKFFIDNWRWSGVPFYLRTGKHLPTRVTEIVIHFNPTPHHLFCKSEIPTNQWIIRIQPDEGLLLKFGMKIPGAGYNIQNVGMDFHYNELSDVHVPSAYERLLHDCMIGDSTLYARGDAVEATWDFVDPILKLWQTNPNVPVYGYPAGSWGPQNSDDLIEGKGVTWRYPCKNLSNDGIYCEL